MRRFLSQGQIADWAASGPAFEGQDRRRPLREALERNGQSGPGQTAGRFYPIACVALEITQRCNLDCTLCYLSDHAEMAFDVPLEALFRRIDMIRDHYGPGTSVQITGGDPTLRKPEDLEALCRYIRVTGLRSCLMTNGIRATGALLERLSGAGLDDVAFHVDLTQERRGYPTEVSLNRVRRDYIRRGRAAGLRVLFNTTVFDGNIRELPALADFFREEAEHLTLVSFQMQAETGRGRFRGHPEGLTQEAAAAALEAGFGARLDFGVAEVGHADCTQYTMVLVAGDRTISALNRPRLLADLLTFLERHGVCNGDTTDISRSLWPRILRRPWLALRILGYLIGRVWSLRAGLWASRGRVHRMSVMIHNFMDAAKLERGRCESCVFMVATEDGPMSMCVHNAKRDAQIFAPVRLSEARWWSAATGEVTARPVAARPGQMPFKRLKGRLKKRAAEQRRPRKAEAE